jgi:hypothetical protein
VLFSKSNLSASYRFSLTDDRRSFREPGFCPSHYYPLQTPTGLQGHLWVSITLFMMEDVPGAQAASRKREWKSQSNHRTPFLLFFNHSERDHEWWEAMGWWLLVDELMWEGKKLFQRHKFETKRNNILSLAKECPPGKGHLHFLQICLTNVPSVEVG